MIIEIGIDDGIDEVNNSNRSKSDFATDRCEEDEGTNGNKILSDVDGSSGTKEDEAEEDYFTGDNRECENKGLETWRIGMLLLFSKQWKKQRKLVFFVL